MAITYFVARARRRPLRRFGRSQGRCGEACRNSRPACLRRRTITLGWPGRCPGQIANAWVLYADGKSDDALKAMSAAADAEDKTEKSPVTPGR